MASRLTLLETGTGRTPAGAVESAEAMLYYCLLQVWKEVVLPAHRCSVVLRFVSGVTITKRKLQSVQLWKGSTPRANSRATSCDKAQ